mgnify:FL=1
MSDNAKPTITSAEAGGTPAVSGDEPASAKSVWRVVLVDDHPLFRDGMARLFAYEDDVEVVGEASSGEEAIERVREAMPDIVLMDIDMPGIGGIRSEEHTSELQ